MDLYDNRTKPLITPEAFYGDRGDCADVCMVILSHEIHARVLGSHVCREAGRMTACNGETPVYVFEEDGIRIAFYLSAMGSAIAGNQVIEANWITGAEDFVMFGSAGSLDEEMTRGRYVIPVRAFRGEGISRYYAPPADYIAVPGSRLVVSVFDKLGIPYVPGAVWTTDAIYMETEGLAAARRSEGCIAVEMEVAGVQAVCSHYGFRLYDFLETGDILGDDTYDVSNLAEVNHRIENLDIALEIVKNVMR